MTKNTRYQKASTQTQEEAIKVAKATQRPGQNKEQTKMIAQGIQKGIEHYKKQQKAKSRELNKRIYKAEKKIQASSQEGGCESQSTAVTKVSALPWILLIISWVGFAAYFLFAGAI